MAGVSTPTTELTFRFTKQMLSDANTPSGKDAGSNCVGHSSSLPRDGISTHSPGKCPPNPPVFSEENGSASAPGSGVVSRAALWRATSGGDRIFEAPPPALADLTNDYSTRCVVRLFTFKIQSHTCCVYTTQQRPFTSPLVCASCKLSSRLCLSRPDSDGHSLRTRTHARLRAVGFCTRPTYHTQPHLQRL